MLKVTIGWEWFHEDLTEEEAKAIDEGRLASVVREDGDNNAAIVEAIRDIKAPTEHVRLALYNPHIADCILVVAWDDRSVECEPDMSEGDDGGWTL